jgi:hypothetical protein
MKKSLKSTLSTLSLIILSVSLLTACDTTEVIYTGGGGGGGGGGYYDPYRNAWYDVYGNQCISYGYPMSGCNFYANGQKITASRDPYYSNLTLYYDYWTYTDSYGFRRGYNGYAWLSSTGILYDGNGRALNEIDQDASDSVDVLAQASEKELMMAQQVGKTLSQKYALAEATGISIAKTLQDWAVLGRDRSRTDQDEAAFGKRLYGIEQGKATLAMKEALKGNTAALSDLNVDVAAHWGTSPETSKQILKSWYKEELAQIGVK